MWLGFGKNISWKMYFISNEKLFSKKYSHHCNVMIEHLHVTLYKSIDWYHYTDPVAEP